MRVRDMEFQIPIPNLPGSEKPDFEIVQRAWWDVINLVYELANEKPRSFLEGIKNSFSRAQREARTPMRLTLELRIMKGMDTLSKLILVLVALLRSCSLWSNRERYAHGTASRKQSHSIYRNTNNPRRKL